jgi:putative flippase GtrA
MIGTRVSRRHWFDRSVTPLIRFVGLSGASFGCNFGLTWLLHDVLSLPVGLSFPIALGSVSLLNFVALRFVVFRGGERPASNQAAIFFPTVAAFRILEYLAFLLLVDRLRVDYQLSMAVVLPVSAVAKYVAFNRTFG